MDGTSLGGDAATGGGWFDPVPVTADSGDVVGDQAGTPPGARPSTTQPHVTEHPFADGVDLQGGRSSSATGVVPSEQRPVFTPVTEFRPPPPETEPEPAPEPEEAPAPPPERTYTRRSSLVIFADEAPEGRTSLEASRALDRMNSRRSSGFSSKKGGLKKPVPEPEPGDSAADEAPEPTPVTAINQEAESPEVNSYNQADPAAGDKPPTEPTNREVAPIPPSIPRKGPQIRSSRGAPQLPDHVVANQYIPALRLPSPSTPPDVEDMGDLPLLGGTTYRSDHTSYNDPASNAALKGQSMGESAASLLPAVSEAGSAEPLLEHVGIAGSSLGSPELSGSEGASSGRGSYQPSDTKGYSGSLIVRAPSLYKVSTAMSLRSTLSSLLDTHVACLVLAIL